MATTNTAEMLSWCQKILGVHADTPNLSLDQFLAGIPRLDSLKNVPSGTVVLVRGDVDAKPGDEVGQGDVRLRSMEKTLKYGIERGWIQVVFGHIGRKPEGSLNKVAARLGQILGQEVKLVENWLNEATLSITEEAAKTISDSQPGTVLVLDNTRRYDIERALWKAEASDLEALAPNLAQFANQFAEKLGGIYINEALSAGSLDSSTVILPAAMNQVALGDYVAGEFDGPMQRCRATEVVIFSGLKIDKLDDLKTMIDRGTVKYVFAAGSLAMALKKAAAQLDGGDFNLGVAEDAAHADKPYYIPQQRIDQAKQMIADGREKGIEFILPIDFILADGQAADLIGSGGQQFDVGPKTNDFFAQKVTEIIAKSQSSEKPLVVFHNGVFGMFEDPRFEAGTKAFVEQLHRMTEAGLEVYVGGGEGGAALDRYGKPDWVTHCFTAGGTVLNALGSSPVPYLQALYQAADRS